MTNYNKSSFLKDSIASVLAQTYPDFELVIYDDCSTDNSTEIIRSFKDNRIKLFINETNLGISRNLNKCLELSKGEIINCFDSDDLMLSDNLKRNFEFFQKNPWMGFAFSKKAQINDKGNIIGKEVYFKDITESFVIKKDDCFNRLLFDHNFICASSVFVKRECFDKLGNFDEQLLGTQDYEMWMRISLHYDAGYIAENLVMYRIHDDNYTTKCRNELRNINNDYLARRTIIFNNKNYFPDTKNALSKMKKSVARTSLELASDYLNDNLPVLTKKYLGFALKMDLLIIWRRKFLTTLIKSFLGKSILHVIRK